MAPSFRRSSSIKAACHFRRHSAAASATAGTAWPPSLRIRFPTPKRRCACCSTATLRPAPPRRSESAPPFSGKVAGIGEGAEGAAGEGCSGRGRTWADPPRGCAAPPPRARPPPRSPPRRRRPPPPRTRRGSTPQPPPWVPAEAPLPSPAPLPQAQPRALSLPGTLPFPETSRFYLVAESAGGV